MPDYKENGYSNFLNIDSLTPKLGTFGNETINTNNIDTFIEDDAIPVPPPTGSDVGYNDNILDGHIELRNGTTVLGYYGLVNDGTTIYPSLPLGDDIYLYFGYAYGLYSIEGSGTQSILISNNKQGINFYGESLSRVSSLGGEYYSNFLLHTWGGTYLTTNYEGSGGPDINYDPNKSIVTAGYSLSPHNGINMGLGGGTDINSNWASVSISGTKMVAVIRPGRLYLYNGSNWAEVQPAGDADYNWNSVSISGDNIVASIYGGRIYYYDGATWTEQQPAGNVDKNWGAVSISGTNIIAGVYNGRIYYYNGATWAEVQPAGATNQNWNSVSIDGTKIIAGIYQGRLYYYNGSSWSEQQPAGASNKQWASVSISGTNIIAGVYQGRLYFYNGSSWAETQPVGATNKLWTSVSISATKMLAGETDGDFYYYNGATWAWQKPNPTAALHNVKSISIDGDNIIVGDYGGLVYYYNGTDWIEQHIIGNDDYWYWLLLKPNLSPLSYTNSASFTYYKSGATTQFRGVMEATGAIYSFDLTVV